MRHVKVPVILEETVHSWPRRQRSRGRIGGGGHGQGFMPTSWAPRPRTRCVSYKMAAASLHSPDPSCALPDPKPTRKGESDSAQPSGRHAKSAPAPYCPSE